MIWDIKPGIGVGPILFGMSPQDVASIVPALPPLHARDVALDGTVTEHRGLETPSVSYEDARVHYIAAGARVSNVNWQNSDAFGQQSQILLQSLERSNGGAFLLLGTILFDKLGIEMTGFYDEGEKRFFVSGPGMQDDRAIAVSHHVVTRRRLEMFGRQLKPISFFQR